MPDTTDKVKAAIARSKHRVAALVALFLAGGLSLADWRSKVEDEIRAGHRAMFSAAYGGTIPAAGMKKLSEITAAQLDYFDKFAAGIESGEIEKGEALGSRAGLYVAAMWPSYQDARRGKAMADGFIEERNILDESAQNCSECLDETARGWVPIGTLSEIGSRICHVNDRCSTIFR